jgi:hypothetical protein
MSEKGQKDSTAALTERNRIALAYLELVKDAIFHKLPEEEKLKLIREVLAIGDETAAWIVAEYDTRDPRKIALRMGVRIFGEEKNSLRRSEYRRGTKEIVVSRKFHQRLIKEVESSELSEHLLKFMIAHELFHHLEAERIGEIYKRYKFKVWQFGPYRKDKFIKGLSDVAAQAFTQSLLGLEISPPVFDYLTYVLYTHA